MGFKQIFNSRTFNRMDALRKKIKSLVDHVLNYWFLDTCNGTQILTMIIRIKLPLKS